MGHYDDYYNEEYAKQARKNKANRIERLKSMKEAFETIQPNRNGHLSSGAGKRELLYEDLLEHIKRSRSLIDILLEYEEGTV